MRSSVAQRGYVDIPFAVLAEDEAVVNTWPRGADGRGCDRGVNLFYPTVNNPLWAGSNASEFIHDFSGDFPACEAA